MLQAIGLPPALPTGPHSADGRARNDGPMAVPLHAVSNRLVIGPCGGGVVSNDVQHVGSRPAFYLDTEAAGRLHRHPVPPQPAKPYRGFFRLHQSLRHICVTVNTTMKSLHHVDPLEVQASVIGDTLHLCSNFHGDRIVDSLRTAICDIAPPEGAARRVAMKDNHLWDPVITARRWRHLQKLKGTFASGTITAAAIERASSEIRNGIGKCKETNLSLAEMADQCAAGFRTILAVLEDLRTTGHSARLAIHYPLKDASLVGRLPPNVSQTMHAEQCIEEYLATHSEDIYEQATRTLGLAHGKHVIVPMAGRFVPCAPCAEVEHHARREGGFFDPARSRFVLSRSTHRIGRAFPLEVQHMALNVLSPNDPLRANERASRIRDQFVQGGPDLLSHDAPVVLDYSLDTDSESSSGEGDG